MCFYRLHWLVCFFFFTSPQVIHVDDYIVFRCHGHVLPLHHARATVAHDQRQCHLLSVAESPATRSWCDVAATALGAPACLVSLEALLSRLAADWATHIQCTRDVNCMSAALHCRLGIDLFISCPNLFFMVHLVYSIWPCLYPTILSIRDLIAQKLSETVVQTSSKCLLYGLLIYFSNK